MNKNHLYFLLVLTILNSLLFLFSYIMMDSARDLYHAHNIVDMVSFPLMGPDIGDFAHVGPIWFYFLSIPLLSGSLVIVALWVGFFSSIKFVLAYLLGKKLLNERFGLLWVCALLLPGWQTIDGFILLHTNLVQTLTLGFFLLLFKFHQEKSPKYFVWAMLVFALTLHAHPSSLILSVFIFWSVFSRWRILSLKVVFYGAALFILPFIPYVLDQIVSGFPDLDRIKSFTEIYSKRVNTATKINNELSVFERLPNFIVSIFYYGPLNIKHIISMTSETLGKLVFSSYFVFLIVSFIGLINFAFKSMRNLIITLQLMTVITLCFILVLSLRNFIPFYMMLVLTPMFTGLIAFGFWNISHKIKLQFIFVLITIFFIFSMLPIGIVSYIYKDNQYIIKNTNEIETATADVQFKNGSGLDGLNIINASKMDDILCGDTYIHGPYSIIMEYTSEVIPRMNCDKSNLKLGGMTQETQKHVFIMHNSFWSKIKTLPTKTINNVFAYTQKFINHSHSEAWEIAEFNPYVHPPRSNIQKNQKQTYVFKFTTNPNSTLVITNILPFYFYVNVKSIEIEGANVELLMKNIGNWMYKCKDCSNQNDINWVVEMIAEDEKSIDINEILK